MRALIILGVLGALGFLVGFAVGRGTRDGIADATSVDFEGGVLTARIDTSVALKQGFQSLFR